MAKILGPPLRTFPTLTGKVHPDVEQAIRTLDTDLRHVESKGLATTAAIAKLPAIPPLTLAQIKRGLELGGADPLNVTDLLGLLAQPQISGIPMVLALPDPQMSQDGQTCRYQGIVYLFDTTTPPGTWVPLGASAVITAGTWVTIPTAAAQSPNLLYQVTDRGNVIYWTRTVGGVQVWQYLIGTMRGTISPDLRPAGLGANDTEFRFEATDTHETFRWTGAAWASLAPPWQDVPYNVGDYIANGAMTWTVQAGDLVTFAYRREGKSVWITFDIETSSIGGVPNTQLLPGLAGFTNGARIVKAPCQILDNGVPTDGVMLVGAGVTRITITRQDGAVFTPSVDNTSVWGQLAIEIA